MTPILVSQRVVTDVCSREKRDALDQRWGQFLGYAGLLPVPVPSHFPLVNFLDRIPWEGLLLTGGNTLGEEPGRDHLERELLRCALQRGVPILGVCRGAQLIAASFGGRIGSCTGHVATTHKLISDDPYLQNLGYVNSFHDYAIHDCGELRAIAHSEDGLVEAIDHPDRPLFACMWHPERDEPFREVEVGFFGQFFRSSR